MLFNQIIVGPIHSRRFGKSLGVNILYKEAKICSFNCIYCECGLNFSGESPLPQRLEVRHALKARLKKFQKEGEPIDVITFAGNGEPTTHPKFYEIVKDTIELRDHYYPEAKVTVLSNATMLGLSKVREALKLVDNNVLKLDSAIQETAERINKPVGNYSVAKVIENMKKFNGECWVQTMFLRGSVNGVPVDNTTEEEINAWVAALAEIKPKGVQLYSIDRPTPYDTLTKVEGQELEVIAERVKAMGIETLVTY